MNPTISVAIHALAAVSRFLLGSVDEIQRKGLKFVDLTDYFSNLRRIAEQIFSEKLTNAARLSRLSWQLDVIDQEHYYLHNHPDYFLSLILYKENRPYASVIYNPLTQDAYSAVVGFGAYVNTKRIRVNKRVSAGHAIVAFDRSALFQYQPYRIFKYWTFTGSSMLDLVRVASGAVDAMVTLEFNESQCAAARLLLQEAGGLIESFEVVKSSVVKSSEIVKSEPVASEVMEFGVIRSSASAFLAGSQYFVADIKTALCPA